MSAKMMTVLATGFVAIGMAGPLAAETSAEDALEYREAAMTALRGHIGAVSKIVRGLVKDHGFLQQHADALAAGAAELEHLFPAGSDVGESQALQAIWEDPEAFAAAVDKAKQATAEFSKVIAEGGDEAAIAAAFREVGGSCRGCHDDFRKSDD
ncbi:MAG: cytochrome c [Woeseia sp.]